MFHSFFPVDQSGVDLVFSITSFQVFIGFFKANVFLKMLVCIISIIISNTGLSEYNDFLITVI